MSGKKTLKEFKPSVSVLKTDYMKDKLENDYREHRLNESMQNHATWCVSLGIVLIGLLPGFLSWNEMKLFNKAWNIVICALALLLAVYFFARRCQVSSELKSSGFVDELLDVEKVSEPTRYTIIMAIGVKNRDKSSSELKFYCRKTDGFLEYCDADVEKTIDENEDTVKEYLKKNYGILEDEIRSITPIEDEPYFSIKEVEGIISPHAFIVYALEFRKTVHDKIASSSQIKQWLSLDEMNANPIAMKLNHDIIGYLKSKEKLLVDSFPTDELHIIWNITKSCNYNCEICATRDNRRDELSLGDKISVLNSLSRYRDRIRMIDFAGGDPCTSIDSLGIIETAIEIFGQRSVSVTTTREGIKSLERLDPKQKQRILNNCELTVDASHENLRRDDKIYDSEEKQYPTHRERENKYNDNSGVQIDHYSMDVKHLTINVPILDDDLDDNEIETLIKIVKSFTEDYVSDTKVHLLRKMRVGNAVGAIQPQEYKKYNPISVAQKIYQKCIENKIRCSYHCSLRLAVCEISDKCNGCTMEKKIGIDCAGNVFACAWGGYLPYADIESNPFYLGNLKDNIDLQAIIENDKTGNRARLQNYLRKSDRRCLVASLACVEGNLRPRQLPHSDPLVR